MTIAPTGSEQFIKPLAMAFLFVAEFCRPRNFALPEERKPYRMGGFSVGIPGTESHQHNFDAFRLKDDVICQPGEISQI